MDCSSAGSYIGAGNTLEGIGGQIESIESLE
jgi:hypothetical protein